MAQLSLSVAGLSSSVNANDTKATNVLTNFANAKGFEGTSQEKLDQIVADLVAYLSRESQNQAKREAANTAEQAVIDAGEDRFEA